MSNNTERRGLTGYLRWSLVWKIAVPLGLLFLAVWFFRGGGESIPTGTTFVSRRGLLRITVLEGGSVSALESQTIKSEVKGQTKILSIEEEGYQVTEEDVANEKVLVTLDNSEIQEKQTQQEIEYQSALATYTEAREQYDIQIKQNESDITSAELDAKFALMDFQKYLGAHLATQIVDERGLELPPQKDLTAALAALQESELVIEVNGSANKEEDATKEADTGPEAVVNEAPPEIRAAIDFVRYADAALLGDGEAQQQLRKLENERLIAEEEKRLAGDKFDGTKRLAEQQFVTQSELDRDKIAVKRSEVATESALTEEELFRKYEFPKQAEKLLSDYEEALRKLERVKKESISKLAQAKAKFKASEAKYALQSQRRREFAEQLENCTIRAKRPGLVVYAGSDDPWRRRGEPVEEGATVYERQEIITIPDMTHMGVEVKVHESSIKKVAKGQKAVIRIDAFPDDEYEGEVERVSVLPDSGQRWMNPDLKLYKTQISIEGVHEGLKPGMSAEVEILVQELPDVVYVPIQAVSNSNGDRVCYVVSGFGGSEMRVVKAGDFNEEFIEIRSGLQEGERVLLRAPRSEQAEAEGTAPDSEGEDAAEGNGDAQGKRK